MAPLVLLPSSKDEESVGAAQELADMMGGLGVPMLCYDFANYRLDGYHGAMQMLAGRDGKASLIDFSDTIAEWAEGDLKGRRASYLSLATGSRLAEFMKTVGERTGVQAIPTGFDELDRLLDGGMYPGLYIMGAMSSLGKTTWALQVADHIAASGHDVLFYSLEQSSDELIAKSLSRMMARGQAPIGDGLRIPSASPKLTSRQILYKFSEWSGRPEQDAFERALEEYGDLAGRHMFIVENDVGTVVVEDEDGRQREVQTVDRVGLDTIRRGVRNHKELTGSSPVVFIDYLQILKPDDPTGRKSDKQNMDETVSELRRIAKTYSIPIFAISSLNRSSYGQAIEMEAFKESGAIEYSSDVLLGLDPKGIKAAEKPKDREENRQTMSELADAELRGLEVVVLKNRMGARGRVPMVLHAKYGLYYEGTVPEPEDEEAAERPARYKRY